MNSIHTKEKDYDIKLEIYNYLIACYPSSKIRKILCEKYQISCDQFHYYMASVKKELKQQYEERKELAYNIMLERLDHLYNTSDNHLKLKVLEFEARLLGIEKGTTYPTLPEQEVTTGFKIILKKNDDIDNNTLSIGPSEDE